MSEADRNPVSGGRPRSLGELPSVAPPADAWPAIQARLGQEEARLSRPGRWKPTSLALAASLLVAVPLVVLLFGRDGERDRELQDWIAYSQELEAQLATLQRRDSMLRGHQAVALDQLEDMVTAIDLELAASRDPARRLTLWQQRTALLNDLVTVQAGASLASLDTPQPVITLNRPPGSGSRSREL